MSMSRRSSSARGIADGDHYENGLGGGARRPSNYFALSRLSVSPPCFIPVSITAPLSTAACSTDPLAPPGCTYAYPPSTRKPIWKPCTNSMHPGLPWFRGKRDGLTPYGWFINTMARVSAEKVTGRSSQSSLFQLRTDI